MEETMEVEKFLKGNLPATQVRVLKPEELPTREKPIVGL
jgi:hypothetical protein